MKGVCAAAVIVGLVAGPASRASAADVFNMPSGQKSLEMVTVGDPGNAADTHYDYCGRVTYTYRIGKYDVTAGQYCQFLNAVARTDTYELYNWQMNLDSYSCGIAQSGEPGSYTYSLTRNPDYPANFISWGDAARFCNWLRNGQPTGDQGPGTTETGSYTLNGAMTNDALMAVTRNPGATYVIPTEDEWYKAAYYKGGSTDAGYWVFPTRTDNRPSNVMSSTGTNNANFYDMYAHTFTDPVNRLTPVGYFQGSPGPYGTFDQGGNVEQWNERNFSNYSRGMRGGSMTDIFSTLGAQAMGNSQPGFGNSAMGFRIALVPEPATLVLLALGGLAAARRRTGSD